MLNNWEGTGMAGGPVERAVQQVTKNRRLWLLFSLVILGTLLRFHALGRYSLWYDEILSAIRAESDISTILGLWSPLDASFISFAFPLHAVFIHFSMYFGKSEFIIRFFPAVFGVLTILVIYKTSEEFFGPREGLISAFLIAISPFHIYYSQEARYYSLFAFLSLLSLFFMYRILKDGKFVHVIGFSVVSILNILTHPFALMVFGMEMLILSYFYLRDLKSRGRISLEGLDRSKAGALLIIAALFLMAVLRLDLWKWVQPLGAGGYPAASFSGAAFSLSLFKSVFSGLSTDSFLDFTYKSYVTRDLFDYANIALYLFFFSAGLYFSIRSEEHRRSASILCFWIFAPFFVLAVFKMKYTDLHLRYLIFLLPAYLMVVSKGITDLIGVLAQRAPRIPFSTVALLLIGLLTLPSIQGQYGLKTNLEDWRSAGAYLEERARPGDLIISDPRWIEPLQFYFNASYVQFKIFTDALRPDEYPFTRHYLVMDVIGGNPEDQIVPKGSMGTQFGTLTLYSHRIDFWKETWEDPINSTWKTLDVYGWRGLIVCDERNATFTHRLRVGESGTYDLYALLQWWIDVSTLRYRIDDGPWSPGFRPSYGIDTGLYIYKEAWLGREELASGEHTITFKNGDPATGRGCLLIDYFYLSRAEDPSIEVQARERNLDYLDRLRGKGYVRTFESEKMPSFTGGNTEDRDASGGAAKYAAKNKDPQSFLVYGPGSSLGLPGKYMATFRVKIAENTVEKNAAVLDIVAGDRLFGELKIKASDFQEAWKYQNFSIEFETGGMDDLQYRVLYLPVTSLWVDVVEVTYLGE